MKKVHASGGAVKGFTLIELLVVMGIIVAFAGAVGLSRRGPGDDALALRTARAQVVASLGWARDYALRHQVTVRILIQATPPPLGDAEKYLGSMQIVAEASPGGHEWEAVGEPVHLPRTVRVVPPAMSPTHVTAGVSWPEGPVAPLSRLSVSESFPVNGRVFGAAYSLGYEPDGRSSEAAPTVVLGLVQPAAGSFPRFVDPAATCRIVVRASGTPDLSEAGHGD